MAVGYTDPSSGVYIYGADDPRQPMDAVLNIGQRATAAELTATRERLEALEQWMGGFQAATPFAPVPLNGAFYEGSGIDSIWSNPTQPLMYRRVGNRIDVNGVVNTKALGSNTVGTLPLGFRPDRIVTFVYMFANDSAALRGVIQLNGDIRLSGVPATVGTDVTFIVPPFYTAGSP